MNLIKPLLWIHCCGIAITLCASCGAYKSSTIETQNSYETYNFGEADRVYKLPKKLNEVSGLTFKCKNTLLVVHDEKGRVYAVSSKSGKIKDSYDVGKNHDYEGLANVNGQIWLLRSNGELIKLGKLKKNVKTKKYKTHLSGENNTEGLVFDPKDNKLIIVCKEESGTKFSNERALYEFDLKKKQLEKKPSVVISFDQVAKKLLELDNDFRSLDELKDGFKPSGIAIHPSSGEYYIVSSYPRLLIVCTPKGHVLYVKQFDRSVLSQPEGIAFDAKGNLFISSEKGEKSSRILKFSPK